MAHYMHSRRRESRSWSGYGELFNISRAHLHNTDEFVDVWFKSLGPLATSEKHLFFDLIPDNAEGRRWVRQSFEQFLGPRLPGTPESIVLRCQTYFAKGPEDPRRDDPDWDLATCVGFAIAWHVRPDCDAMGLGSHRTRWSDCLSMHDMTDAALDMFFDPTAVVHEELMKNTEHIFLEIMFVDPEVRGNGAGNEFLNKIVDLADHLGLPVYLSASVIEGRYFSRFGFCSFPEWESEDMQPVVPMKRLPQERRHSRPVTITSPLPLWEGFTGFGEVPANSLLLSESPSRLDSESWRTRSNSNALLEALAGRRKGSGSSSIGGGGIQSGDSKSPIVVPQIVREDVS